MPQPAAKPFFPPTAQQVREHLERHPPRGPGMAIAWLPLAAFVAAMALWSTAQNPLGFLLALLLLSAMMVGVSLRARRLRALESQTTRTQELLAQRQWHESLRSAWRALPRLTTLPEWHGRTVSAMAHNLDRLRAYDAAIVAYDYLVAHLPEGHSSALQFRLQRAIAQLANHQLLDADNELRRLRGAIEPFKGSPLAALYRAGVLAQQVLTNHHAEAVAQAEGLVEDLRPLGIEAGYGYALMALAHDTMATMPGATPQHIEEHRRQASLWWSRAALLLPVGALVERLDALEPLAQRMASGAGGLLVLDDPGRAPLAGRGSAS